MNSAHTSFEHQVHTIKQANGFNNSNLLFFLEEFPPTPINNDVSYEEEKKMMKTRGRTILLSKKINKDKREYIKIST
jgi:hypothetical protein